MHRKPNTRPSRGITSHEPDTASSDRPVLAAVRWRIALHVLLALIIGCFTAKRCDGANQVRQQVPIEPWFKRRLQLENPAHWPAGFIVAFRSAKGFRNEHILSQGERRQWHVPAGTGFRGHHN